MAETVGLDFIHDLDRAAALLHPIRLRILHALARPDSAAGLARRFKIPRQTVNYHIRELARSRFLRRASQRRKGNMIESRYVATALTHVLAPDLLQHPSDISNQMTSSPYFANLSAKFDSEDERSSRRTREKCTAPSVFSFESELRVGSQESAFAQRLRRTMVKAIGQLSLPAAHGKGSREQGTLYRVVVGFYPVTAKDGKP